MSVLSGFIGRMSSAAKLRPCSAQQPPPFAPIPPSPSPSSFASSKSTRTFDCTGLPRLSPGQALAHARPRGRSYPPSRSLSASHDPSFDSPHLTTAFRRSSPAPVRVSNAQRGLFGTQPRSPSLRSARSSSCWSFLFVLLVLVLPPSSTKEEHQPLARVRGSSVG